MDGQELPDLPPPLPKRTSSLPDYVKFFLDEFLKRRKAPDELLESGILLDDPTSPEGASFGQPLHLVPMSSMKIPNVVVECCNYIETHGFREEGLFRVPGVSEEVVEIKRQYNSRSTCDLTKYEVSSVAGALKLFFREMPEPLFMFSCYDRYMAAAREHVGDDEGLLQALSEIVINQLPVEHSVLLVYLLNFLKRCSKHSSVNMMSVDNLAMVFAPNVLKSRQETLQQIMEDSTYIKLVLKTMINGAEFFDTALSSTEVNTGE
eukprot:CAMPEP_0174261978 /NCGR_PEP_ID=MMETSP0439-20130205/12704_1 /TAXON_ID=0 /ORGANISM="Stereomyxa ramosa, Strain Chinc5" /LENGTH=262 /DNA_ID=CAMNT_0015346603 /DNA_START=128 /DNA_END=916 /DNA_ORIENTATION=+